jgi:SAM-dependent methyltransferase
MAPIADYNLWSTWQALYDVQAIPERTDIRLSYHRAALFNTLFLDRATRLPSILGWTPAKHICVIGCGFGWFVEQLVALGYTQAFGFDPSTFIQANFNGTEEADINAAIAAVGLSPTVGAGAAIKARIFDGGTRARVPIGNQDGKTASSRSAIVHTFNQSRVDVIHTQNVVEALTDAEVAAYAPQLRQIAPVTHLIGVASPGNVPGLMNWKTLVQWKALLTPDTVIDDSTYQTL